MYFVALAVLSQVEVIFGGRNANPATFVDATSVHPLPVNPVLDAAPAYVTQAIGQIGDKFLTTGHSPWWNPYSGLGAPLAPDLQSAVFYPLSLLVYVLHLEASRVDVIALSNIVIAGLGAYWLGRVLGMRRRGALVVGTAFCLAGSFIWLGPLYGTVVAWSPLSIALTLRIVREEGRPRVRAVVLLGLVTMLQTLAGFPEGVVLQILLLTVPLTVAALVRLPARRVAAAAGVIGGFVLGLLGAAFLLVPFLTALPAEHFWNGPGTALVHVPVWTDLLLGVPFAFGHWFNTRSLSVVDWYNVGGYTGMVALWLATAGVLAGWRKRTGVVVPMLVAVVVAVGWYNGLPPFVFIGHLPLLSRMALGRLGVPELELAVAVLAGLAVDLPANWKASALATVVCGAGLVVWTAHAYRGAAGNDVLFAALCLGLVAGGFTLLIALSRRQRSGAAQPALRVTAAGLAIGLVAIELLALSNLDFRNLPRRRQSATPTWVAYVRNHLGVGGRLYGGNGLLAPNFAGDYGIADISFEDALVPKTTQFFLEQEVDPGNPDPLAFIGTPEGRTIPAHLVGLELSGVTLLALPDPGCQPACRGLPRVFLDRPAGVAVFKVPDPQPLLWFPPRVSPGSTVPAQPLQAVSVNAPIHQKAPAEPVAVHIVHQTNTLLGATISTRQARLLVLREVSFPGWRARLDGRAVPIHTADGVFQSITVPAGHHQVVFTYRPPDLRVGEGLSLLALIVALASLVLAGRRHRSAV